MTRTTPNKSARPLHRLARGIAKSLAVGLLVGGALMMNGAAHAQTAGMWIDRDQLVEKLAGEYAESPTALGLASTGGVVELFATPTGDTWTIVITMPNGLSRIIVSGEGWSVMPITIAGRDS